MFGTVDGYIPQYTCVEIQWTAIINFTVYTVFDMLWMGIMVFFCSVECVERFSVRLIQKSVKQQPHTIREVLLIIHRNA